MSEPPPSPTVFLDPESASRPYAAMLRPGASLETAVERPRRLHAYGGESDLIVLAAGLLWGVTRAHALLDGNKRASIILADDMLSANGHHLAGSDDDLTEIALVAAAGTVDEQRVIEMMRPLVREGRPEEGFAARYPVVIERLAA